jgi:hypothetical protein
MKSETSRIASMVAVAGGIYLLLFLLIYFIPLDAIDFDTLAPVVSILSICMSTLAVVIGRRSARPANERTITITIEDSSGERTRMVTRSSRCVDEVKRDFERLVGNTA